MWTDRLLCRSRPSTTSKWNNLLGMAIARCVSQRKLTERVWAQHRAEAAQFLERGDEFRADEKVIACLKERAALGAYTEIQEYCEEVIDNLQLIEQVKSKECPQELKEAVCSLIYTALKCSEFVELEKVKKMFEKKFGSDFVNSVSTNLSGIGSQLLELLSNPVPPRPARVKYMVEIAKDFNLNWTPATESTSTV
ncbi:hypothetical protein KP509_07G010400 [Ceratopteris richardii]|uniref:Vacuolar protein sorting-associated protein Ist1 n=1 Tax=Ceratopteris richardii TaxID=49495 RepID=A0A8T2UE32_CERRI|nr:hypothetical protein KP509_07G010400 [Ceratopteris richardii]